MKVVIAVDSFKGSLSSIEAGNAVRKGILRACDADAVVFPLADGGEGTVEALVTGMHGVFQNIEVTGPLGDPVICRYGVLKERETAIIEMSGAAGLTQVPNHLRNPMKTTTFGVGEVIRDAIGKGCRNFIIGIGGSATNDGGAGMLQALGFELLAANNAPISFGAEGLKGLVRISAEHAMKELAECTFRIACDVNNPLCGPRGASFVYGPQKGADPQMVVELDEILRNYAGIAGSTFGRDLSDVPGTGAAGGMGFAFLSFLNAKLEPGIEIILKEIGLEKEVQDADYVITGEGRLDFQTAMGKAPIGVARLAKKYGKKVIAFAGAVTEEARECNIRGIDAYFSITNRVMTLEEAMNPKNAAKNMTSTVEQVFRLITSTAAIQR
jgi:glycerate kinase